MNGLYMFILKNPSYKWMMTGGTPIPGNLHLAMAITSINWNTPPISQDASRTSLIRGISKARTSGTLGI